MTTPEVETLSYLRSALSNRQVQALVTQNPDGTVAITVDVGAGMAQITMPALQGPAGPAGQAQFGLIPMPDVYDTPNDLPTVLVNNAADIGKYWIIEQTDAVGGVTSIGAYIWWGTEYRFLPFGNQGPPGPYPVIQPYATLVGPEGTSQIAVTGAGTAANPYLLNVELSVPIGPSGPCAPLASFPDVIETVPPTIGQFMTATGTHVTYGGESLPVWAPANTGDVWPMPYVVPGSAFNSQFGITFSSTVTIATFSVPPKPYAWKPLVFGQIKLFELELSLQPFLIGVEVLLGNPTSGTLVARGFGNCLGGICTLIPHCSTPATPTVVMNPWNAIGSVPANHTGAHGTLFVNVINDGIAAIWDYNASDASIFVMACPVTTQAELGIMAYGSLPMKVSLSAAAVSSFSGVRRSAYMAGHLVLVCVARVSKRASPAGLSVHASLVTLALLQGQKAATCRIQIRGVLAEIIAVQPSPVRSAGHGVLGGVASHFGVFPAYGVLAASMVGGSGVGPFAGHGAISAVAGHRGPLVSHGALSATVRPKIITSIIGHGVLVGAAPPKLHATLTVHGALANSASTEFPYIFPFPLG